MNALMIILMGVSILAGIYWQLILYNNDGGGLFYVFDNIVEKYEAPKRLYAPIFISLILFFGTIIWGIIAILVDDNSQLNTLDFLIYLFRIFILGFLWIVKSYFGPLILTFLLCVSIYYLFEYGQIKHIPLVSMLYHWAFEELPGWVEITYYVLVIINCFGGSLFDFFSETIIGSIDN